MLSALHSESYRRVFAPGLQNAGNVRQLGRENSLVCPYCEATMHLKAGSQKIWHFAHDHGKRCTPDDPDYRPESDVHRCLKVVFRRWLISHIGYDDNEVQVESRVEGTDRFADVMLVSEENRIAFEIQFSDLTPENWSSRHEDYQSANVTDIWVLVGGPHVRLAEESSPAETNSFKLSSLARRVVEETGRLFWIDKEELRRLKKLGDQFRGRSSIAEVHALEVLADHYYEARGSPAPRAAELQDRPFPERPARLLEKEPWEERVQGKSLSVRMKKAEKAPLTEFYVRENASEVVLESPAASATEIREAWKWARKQRNWHEEWTQEKRRRDRIRQLVAQKNRRSDGEAERDVLVKVGQVVREGLSELLVAVGRLKSRAEEDTPDSSRHSHALPDGVWKWPISCWTPLVKLDVPLDWTFGTDPRVWQMRVYVQQFYHHYAEGLEDQRKSGGYSVRTSSALEALDQAGLIGSARGLEKILTTINRKVDEAVMVASARPEWIDDHLIKLHKVRHLVLLEYFERLRSFRFLTRGDTRVRAASLAGASRFRSALKGACTLYRRMKGDQSIPSGFLSRLGHWWLKLAWICGGVKEDGYKLPSARHRPYFDEGVCERLARAIREGDLQATESGLETRSGETITEAD